MHKSCNSSVCTPQEQLHSEQKEADAITQPLLETEAGFIKVRVCLCVICICNIYIQCGGHSWPCFCVSMQNLELYLNHRDTSALRKRELLYKRWTECVWLPIQRSITQHFTQHGYNETKNMRSLHTNYINYCNAKVYISMDRGVCSTFLMTVIRIQ